MTRSFLVAASLVTLALFGCETAAAGGGGTGGNFTIAGPDSGSGSDAGAGSGSGSCASSCAAKAKAKCPNDETESACVAGCQLELVHTVKCKADAEATLTCMSGAWTCDKEGKGTPAASCIAGAFKHFDCLTKNPGDGCAAGSSSGDGDKTCSLTITCSGKQATAACDGTNCTCAGDITNKAKFAQGKACLGDTSATFAVKCGVK